MPNENFFVSNPNSAIAYLYVQQQDLTGKSPVEVFQLFEDAKRQIDNYDAARYSKRNAHTQ
jgi:hypothetical protein